MNRGNEIVELRCDGPGRHINYIDPYRAKSMAGEPCRADPNCHGRIRLDSMVVEAKVPLVTKTSLIAASSWLAVAIGVCVAFYVAYGGWPSGSARTVASTSATPGDPGRGASPKEIQTHASDSSPSDANDKNPVSEGAPRDDASGPDPSTATGSSKKKTDDRVESGPRSPRSGEPAAPATQPGAPVAKGTGLPSNEAVAPTQSTSGEGSWNIGKLTNTIKKERIVPFLQESLNDLRVIGIGIALLLLLAIRELATAGYGLLCAVLFLTLGANFGESAALWGAVLGFGLGTIRVWRLTRRHPRKPARG